MKDKKHTHIWPQYINSKLKLSEGRKISKEDAVKDPTINEIEKALKKLNIEYELIENHAYPGEWWNKCGEIKIDKVDNKLELLREISKKIKSFRH